SSSLARSRSAAFSCEPRASTYIDWMTATTATITTTATRPVPASRSHFMSSSLPGNPHAPSPRREGAIPCPLACLLPPDPTAHEVLLEEGDRTTREFEAVGYALDAVALVGEDD